jgi:hypothetical protein
MLLHPGEALKRHGDAAELDFVWILLDVLLTPNFCTSIMSFCRYASAPRRVHSTRIDTDDVLVRFLFGLYDLRPEKASER